MMLAPTHDPQRRLYVQDGNINDLDIIREIWCEDVYRVRPHLDADVSTVVDVGAAFGAFTVLALTCCPDARGVAIEPSPERLQLLRTSLAANNVNRRVTVLDTAVGPNGDALLTRCGGQSRLTTDPTNADPVRVRALPRLLDACGVSDIDILKIDAEGAEGGAILSLGPERLSRIGYVAVEWDTASTGFGDVVEHLSETHSVTTLGAHDRGGYLYAVRY